MELKTFRAYSMAEALEAVKTQLGQDAVILNTRSFKRGGVLGIGARTIIEVTASPAENSPDRSLARETKRVRSLDLRKPMARRAYANSAAGRSTRLAAPVVPLAADLNHEQQRSQRLAQARAEMQNREQQASTAQVPEARIPREAPLIETTLPGKTTKSIETIETISPSSTTNALEGNGVPSARSKDVERPQRFILTPAGMSTASEANPQKKDELERSVVAGNVVPLKNVNHMQTELTAIKDLVGQVLQRQVVSSGHGQPAMPQKLFDMYLHLLSQELSEDLADQIINSVRDELTVEQLEDERLVRDTLMRHLMKIIPTTEHAVAPESPDGRPLTIALIGPTGVGKTTTLAKIAATLKLHRKKRVGLITADTYRIAAVDQLRTYANIIGIPLKVTLTPAEMRQAVHALSDCDVILIDTAGRSQNDSARIEELKRVLEAGDPHEVHLVLSSTASEKAMIQEAEAFGAVGVDKVVMTKLDEAVSFGMLVNVLRRVGKELSFITTGQEVPDHIEPGRPDRLANLILGGESGA